MGAFTRIIMVVLLLSPLSVSAKELVLDAVGGVLCKKDGRVCTAKNNVRVAYDGYRSRSDMLTAYFAKDRSIDRLQTSGNVVMHYGTGYQAKANQLTYRVPAGKMVLEGNVELRNQSQHQCLSAPRLFIQMSGAFSGKTGARQQAERVTVPDAFHMKTPTIDLWGDAGTFQMSSGAYKIDRAVQIIFDAGIIRGAAGHGNFKDKTYTVLKASDALNTDPEVKPGLPATASHPLLDAADKPLAVTSTVRSHGGAVQMPGQVSVLLVKGHGMPRHNQGLKRTPVQ